MEMGASCHEDSGEEARCEKRGTGTHPLGPEDDEGDDPTFGGFVDDEAVESDEDEDEDESE